MTLDEVQAVYHAALRYARAEILAIKLEADKKSGAGERREQASRLHQKLLAVVRDIDG